MKPPADYVPPPYPLPEGKSLKPLPGWMMPMWCPRIVIQYRDWPPYHCAIERLPFEGETVIYSDTVMRVVDRKYTLPSYGNPETWLRLEAA